MALGSRKILVVGHLARDIVQTPLGGSSFWGGSAYHVSLGASLFLGNGEVVIKSVVGKDFDFSRLKKLGVDISEIATEQEVKTDKHWLNETGTKREYKTEGYLSGNISLLDLKIDKKEIGWIHFSSAPPQQQSKWIRELDVLGWEDIPRSCDTFETFTRECPISVKGVLESCNLGFANEEEWIAVDGKKLRTKIVVKLGSRGASIYNKGVFVFDVPTRKVEIIKDTTGAGDVVAGVYLALRLRGVSERESLMEACRLATISIEEFGTEHLVNRVRSGESFVVKAGRN